MSYEIQLVTPTLLQLNASRDIIRRWREYRKQAVPGARYTPQVRKGSWDGYKRPGRMRGGKLYVHRGYTDKMRDDFRLESIERVCPEVPGIPLSDILEENPTLYDYQAASLKLIALKKWGNIALATNAGKGAIIALAAEAARRANLKTLVLTDEVSVFGALVGEIEKWAPECDLGRVEAGLKRPPPNEVVVGMIPTLARRTDLDEWVEWFSSFDMVLLDEADKATAKSWQDVLKKLKNTEYRIGFSGSFPEDDSFEFFLLEQLIGPKLLTIKNEILIDREISSKPLVELISYETSNKEWASKELWKSMTGPEKRTFIYDNWVTYNKERHKLIASQLHKDERNVIIVNKIEHGKQLLEYIPDSVFIYGETDKKERQQVLDQFEEGEIQNLITTKILDRGSNRLGHAHCLLFVSGEGSNRQTLQRIGRGLRRSEGKEYVWIRDIMDRGHKYLEKASKKRVEVYTNENFDIKVVSDAEETSTEESTGSGVSVESLLQESV